MYYNDYDSFTATKVLTTGAGAATGIVAGLGVMLLIMGIIGLAISVVMIISLWKIFKKAGKNGWEAIIPIYNMITLVQIIEKPMWYIIFFFLPFTQLIIWIALAEKFGKPTSFGILTFFFPFVCLPMLAFGKDAYRNASGPAAAAAPAEPVATAAQAPSTTVAEPTNPVASSETPSPATEPVAAPSTPATEPVSAAPEAPAAPAPAISETPVAPETPATPEPVSTQQPVIPEAPITEQTTPATGPVTPTSTAGPAAEAPASEPKAPVNPIQ